MEVQAEPSPYPARTSDDRPKIYDGIAQEAFPPGILAHYYDILFMRKLFKFYYDLDLLICYFFFRDC